jgi:hypothetical protein
MFDARRGARAAIPTLAVALLAALATQNLDAIDGPAPGSGALGAGRWPSRHRRRRSGPGWDRDVFTFRVRGAEGAHRYTSRNISIIRRKTGDPRVPIHVIGGIAPSPGETRGFARAVRQRRVIGASYYTFPVTPPGDWATLRQLEAVTGASPGRGAPASGAASPAAPPPDARPAR